MPRSPRRPASAALAALALSTGLALGVAACSRDSQPAAPATSVAPDSSARSGAANTVPPGVSGQGSKSGQGVEGAAP